MFVFQLIGFNQDTALNKTTQSSSAFYSQADEESCKISKRPRFSEFYDRLQVETSTDNKNTNDSLIQVKIVYDQSANNDPINILINTLQPQALNICEPNCLVSTGNLDKGQTLLTSYFQPIKSTTDLHTETRLSPIEIDEPGNLIICDNEKTDQKWLLWRSKHICRKYIRLNISKNLIHKRIQRFLVLFARKAQKQFWSRRNLFKENNKVTRIYRWLITFHRFITEFVKESKGKFSKKKTKTKTKMTSEALVANRRIQKILNDNVGTAREGNDENTVHTGQQPSDVGTKRLPKNQRITDNNRLLLTENAQESSEKEFRKSSLYILL